MKIESNINHQTVSICIIYRIEASNTLHSLIINMNMNMNSNSTIKLRLTSQIIHISVLFLFIFLPFNWKKLKG